MWLTLRALLLAMTISLCARAETRTLALYVTANDGLDAESRLAMTSEVQRLLEPAGLDVLWKGPADRRAGEDFEFVAVASFEGACPECASVVNGTSVSLADTSISDGRILPFFRVDCGLVARLLGNRADRGTMGRALGRVIAHELYHIIAQTVDHSDTGVAKAIFSLHDLTSSRFEFDAGSVARMHPTALLSYSPSPVR